MHSADEKETVPLSIHHLPFALTFAFFGVRCAPWSWHKPNPCKRCVHAFIGVLLTDA